MFKLNYNAHLSNQIGVIMGPNVFEERLQVVTQHFDLHTGVTTLELKVYHGED